MQSGGGTPGQPGTSQVFLPPGQPEAAGLFGSTLGPLANIAANGGAGTPAATAYPQGSSFVSNFLTGGTDPSQTPFNDLLTRAFQPTYTAADYAAQSLYPRGIAQGDTLNALGEGAVGPAGQALNQGFDPAYGQAVSGMQNNPYYGQALAGAQQGATLGAAGADQLGQSASQVAGTVNPLIQSGFDPQSALFSRSRQQLMDQTNAVNAMSGVAGTPYGASVSANALGNFDTNWQNQQLARQTSAAGAAGQAADRAGLLSSMAPGIASSSAALPSNAYTGQIGQILSALGARNQGAASGLSNYSTGLADATSGFQGGQNAAAQGAQYASQFGAAPYNLGTGVASNALSGLTSNTNLGNNQYQLPQQVIGDLNQYMGLGQSAAQIGGNLQNQAFGQNAQAIGGGLSAANQLFGGGGGGGLFSGLGSGLGTALGGGFGGAGGAGLGTAAELAAFEGPWAGAGAAEAGGGLASLAPLALSA
jgi:hypothetical protein